MPRLGYLGPAFTNRLLAPIGAKLRADRDA